MVLSRGLKTKQKITDEALFQKVFHGLNGDFERALLALTCEVAKVRYRQFFLNPRYTF